MRYLKCIMGAAAALAALAPARQASAACSGQPEFDDHDLTFIVATGDEFFGGQMCTPTPRDPWSPPAELRDPHWFNQAKNFFQMDRGDWDDGRGWSQPCNHRDPFGRTLTAIWTMGHSSPQPYASINLGIACEWESVFCEPFTWFDMTGNVLHWGVNFAASAFANLDGECEWNDANATHFEGFFGDYTELYHGFFYNSSVVDRAGTLLHEAIHASGECDDLFCTVNSRGHNASDSSCNRGASCDSFFRDTVGGTLTPNSWQVIWLWWYAEEAINTNDVWRERAAISANAILRNGFATDTGTIVWWRSMADGLRRRICDGVPPQPPFFNACDPFPF